VSGHLRGVVHDFRDALMRKYFLGRLMNEDERYNENCYIAKERPALLCRKILLNTCPNPKKDFSKTPQQTLLATTERQRRGQRRQVEPEAKAQGASEKYIHKDHVFPLSFYTSTSD
jgi:hypothetical protein